MLPAKPFWSQWGIHLTQVATRCCGRAKASTKKRIPRLLLWRGVGLRSASDSRSCRPKAATAMNSRVGRLGGHSHDSRNLTFLFRSREATTHRVYLNEVDTPLEPKLLILTRATLPTRHRQRPDPSQHVAEQPPVQIPLGQQQPVIPRVLDQPTAGLHQPVLQARQRPTLDPVRQSEPSPQVAQVVGQHAELEFLPQALEEWIALNERPRLRPARHPHRRSPAVPSTGK